MVETAYNFGYGVGADTGVNTVISGTGGNMLGGLSLNAPSASTVSNLSTGSSYVLAPIAAACGSIDLVLSVREETCDTGLTGSASLKRTM